MRVSVGCLPGKQAVASILPPNLESKSSAMPLSNFGLKPPPSGFFLSLPSPPFVLFPFSFSHYSLSLCFIPLYLSAGPDLKCGGGDCTAVGVGAPV